MPLTLDELNEQIVSLRRMVRYGEGRGKRTLIVPLEVLTELLRRADLADVLHVHRKALRDALQSILDHDPDTCPGITPRDCLESVQETARAALSEKGA